MRSLVAMPEGLWIAALLRIVGFLSYQQALRLAHPSCDGTCHAPHP
jgi:hypothetical protein